MWTWGRAAVSFFLISYSENYFLWTNTGHQSIGLTTSCGQAGEGPRLLMSTVCVGRSDSVVSESMAVRSVWGGQVLPSASSPPPPHQHTGIILGWKMGQRRLAILCGTLPRAWVHFGSLTSCAGFSRTVPAGLWTVWRQPIVSLGSALGWVVSSRSNYQASLHIRISWWGILQLYPQPIKPQSSGADPDVSEQRDSDVEQPGLRLTTRGHTQGFLWAFLNRTMPMAQGR